MVSFTAKPVENLLRAKSVAIVGASQKGAWPQGIYRNLKGAQFPGGVYLINPNYNELFGDKCYPNLAALPEVPDELLVLIPTRAPSRAKITAVARPMPLAAPVIATVLPLK